jgi:phospholipid transport system transporter-binding protein
MQRATFSRQSAGAVRIEGDLTVETVPQLYRDGRRLIAQSGEELRMDLAGVARADSGGLALLVDWLATAAQQGKTLRYTNLPATIQALAGLSEVTALLTEPAVALAPALVLA